jgi:hypothetical protein
MYKGTLEECGIPLSVFHSFNHAIPLKQSNGTTRKFVKHVCHNCGATSSITWYIDPAASEESLLYNCSACYWYRSRRRIVRSSALFNSFRAKPTSGPCMNCQVTESTQWHWRPRDKDCIIYVSCLSYWSKNQVDRLPEERKPMCGKWCEKPKRAMVLSTTRKDKRLGKVDVIPQHVLVYIVETPTYIYHCSKSVLMS